MVHLCANWGLFRIPRCTPPKNALPALFSDEVRLTCCKIPYNYTAVQIISYQFHLRLRLNIKTFSGYFFEPICNVIGQTDLSEPVMQIKSRLPYEQYCNKTSNPANEKFVAFGMQFLHSWAVSEWLKKTTFQLSSNEQISFAPFFEMHHTTQSCVVLASSTQLASSCSGRLSHFYHWSFFFPPNPERENLLVQPTERKERQTSLLLLKFSWHS